MVFRHLRKLFGRSHEGPAGVPPEQAEIRLKALKGRLTRNKSEAKRLSSATEKQKTMTPEKKAENKARLKELEAERKEVLTEMKALHKRLPKK